MKRVLFLIILFCTYCTAFSQQHEVGLLGGGMYYVGDLNPYFHFRQTKPAVGVLYRYNMNYRMSLRGHFLLGSIEGADSVVKYNTERNLSFKSMLMELGGQFELSYHKFKIGNYKDAFTPYLFVGVSFFKFNPKAKYNGEWVELNQLGTEGQGTYSNNKDFYKTWGVAIPFGIGVKLSLGGSSVLGFEWGLRKTFTDYLDDVSTVYANPAVLAKNSSTAVVLADRAVECGIDKTGFQRGNPNTNDWYSFIGLSLTFKIFGDGNSCSSFGNNNKFTKKFRPRHIAR